MPYSTSGQAALRRKAASDLVKNLSFQLLHSEELAYDKPQE